MKNYNEIDTAKTSARAHLAEAARRRETGGNFYWVLLGWASNARRRAVAKPEAQGVLFR